MEKNPRQELAAIGHELISLSDRPGPLNVARAGDLFKRLGLLYSQLVNAEQQHAASCTRCGALKADHMDYGRQQLVCPTIAGGTWSPRR